MSAFDDAVQTAWKPNEGRISLLMFTRYACTQIGSDFLTL